MRTIQPQETLLNQTNIPKEHRFNPHSEFAPQHLQLRQQLLLRDNFQIKTKTSILGRCEMLELG